MRRLAYIRYLHQLAGEQARLPEPLSSASLLMLHDAAESFLLLAAEHLDAEPPHKFEQYWDVLNKKLPAGTGLAGKQGMRRLNRLRVSLKHHGGHPGVSTIDQAVADTKTFMTANTQLVFGLDYDTVSMAHVITQAPVRQLAETAEKANADGDRKAAMVALVDAFEELFDPHRSNAWLAFYDPAESPLTFGPRLNRPLDAHKITSMFHTPRNAHEARRFGEQIGTLTKIVEQLRPAVQMAVLDISFAAYQRFRSLIPTAYTYGDGKKRYHAPVNYDPSGDDFQFCLQFIVTAAVRLAEVEANLARPSWLPESRWDEQHWETIAEKGSSRTSQSPAWVAARSAYAPSRP